MITIFNNHSKFNMNKNKKYLKLNNKFKNGNLNMKKPSKNYF